MSDDDVYFTVDSDDKKPAERVTKRGELLDEIVGVGGTTHLERLDEQSAFLGVEVDEEYRQFLIRADGDELFVIPYEEKSDESRAGVGE